MISLKDESVKIMNDFDRKNRSAVMNLLMHRYSIPEYDADDILQDAWLLLIGKITVGELPDVPQKLSAYLMTVCSNKAHEYLRKREYEAMNPSLDDDTLTAEKITFYEKEIQSWNDFIEECDRAQQRKLALIEHEVNKLSPRQRALITGYYYDDMSMSEIASLQGYSNAEVAKATKARIIAGLRKSVQRQEGAIGDGLSPVAFLCNALNIRCFIERERWQSL